MTTYIVQVAMYTKYAYVEVEAESEEEAIEKSFHTDTPLIEDEKGEWEYLDVTDRTAQVVEE